jgi:hypothetical protein
MGVASKILHAGIRDIAALDTLQLLAIDIGNRFAISSFVAIRDSASCSVSCHSRRAENQIVLEDSVDFDLPGGESPERPKLSVSLTQRLRSGKRA